MIAEAVRRSPLADYREPFVALSAETRGELSLRELPFLSQVNFRVDPKDAGSMQRVATSLGGLAVPIMPNTVVSKGDRRALWLGPDEWLIVGPDGTQLSLIEALSFGLAGTVGTIVDVSANRTVLEVSGPKAAELLAHGIPIDLDARSLGPGRCAQTLLAKAQVIIERVADDPVFHLYVRSSFASYVAEWLLDAATDIRPI